MNSWAGSLAVAVGGLAVAQGDDFAVGSHDPPAGERDAVGVAAEVAEHALGGDR